MTRLVPDQEWWTPAEIAAAQLPDLPGTRKGVQVMIDRLLWRSQKGLARRREGRGGGWEYHWKLFPSRAQRKLLNAAAAPVMPERPSRDMAWKWFERLSG